MIWGMSVGFYKTEALVLRNREFREADQLVTLLSPDYGKLKVVARGSRKPKSHLRGGIQAFTQTKLMLHTGRSLDIITGCEISKYFYFREDLDKLTVVMYWADLLERILPEKEANPAVYYLFLSLLYLLESVDQNSAEIRALNHIFELKLVSLAGYIPSLVSCIGCQEDLISMESPLGFSLEHGGAICSQCIQKAETRMLPISRGTLALMQYWLSMEVQHFRRIKVLDYNLKELDRLLPAYLEYHFEQGIHAANLSYTLLRDTELKDIGKV
jgi:DNA repair protein RecO (recombination protein O)